MLINNRGSNFVSFCFYYKDLLLFIVFPIENEDTLSWDHQLNVTVERAQSLLQNDLNWCNCFDLNYYNIMIYEGVRMRFNFLISAGARTIQRGISKISLKIESNPMKKSQWDYLKFCHINKKRGVQIFKKLNDLNWNYYY